MEQYQSMQEQTEQPSASEFLINPKMIISKSFFAVSALAAVTMLAELCIQLLVRRFAPEIKDSGWYIWALTIISLIGCGFPVYFLIMRTIPDSPKKEISKIRPSDFVMFFFICCAAMYLSNFITQFISLAIRLIKGGELLNPLDAIVNSNYIIAFIYAVLIAPVFEEIIFRKLLLNKLRRFGDLPAILMTGLAFGLFHFNFLQFFYAAVLGFLFAYITIRSNTIAYSVILHMIVNFIGTSAAFFVMKLNIAFAMLLALWVFTALILGVLFFVLNIKRIRFERALQTVKASEFVLNPGFILFLLISIAAFAINTLA